MAGKLSRLLFLGLGYCHAACLQGLKAFSPPPACLPPRLHVCPCPSSPGSLPTAASLSQPLGCSLRSGRGGITTQNSCRLLQVAHAHATIFPQFHSRGSYHFSEFSCRHFLFLPLFAWLPPRQANDAQRERGDEASPQREASRETMALPA